MQDHILGYYHKLIMDEKEKYNLELKRWEINKTDSKNILQLQWHVTKY